MITDTWASYEQRLQQHHCHLQDVVQAADAVLPAQANLADRALAKLGDWMVAGGLRLRNRLEDLQRLEVPTSPMIQKAN